MSKNELEKIVLDTLEQFQAEIRATQKDQTKRITTLEKLLKSYEKRLIELSDLYKELIPLSRELELLFKENRK